jgi:A/G-specific adenine glycosylase
MRRRVANEAVPKEAEVERTTSLPSEKWKRSFRTALLTWFAKHSRDLPWRKSRDLYRIWISEIMLQQTQVATVIPYFERFIATFPTVADLAAADEHDVMRHWEGLGYYRRARQLHAAAKQIVTLHKGKFPTNVDDVRGLPGIGRYTAGAILSIGLDAKLPILEANTIRLLARLSKYAGDCASRQGQEHLWAWSEAILPEAEVGRFNQALMELGSLVCTPKQPDCENCPAVKLCPTFAENLQKSIPAPKRPKAFEETREAAVIVLNRRREVLIRHCQPGERWSGLWDFLRVSLPLEPTRDNLLETASQQVETRFGFQVDCDDPIATLKHGVTRFKITLLVLPAAFRKQPAKLNRDEFVWSSISGLEDRPLHSSARRIAARLDQLLRTSRPKLF